MPQHEWWDKIKHDTSTVMTFWIRSYMVGSGMSLMFTETETIEYVVNNRLCEERRAWINEMTAESQFSSHSLSKNKLKLLHIMNWRDS